VRFLSFFFLLATLATMGILTVLLQGGKFSNCFQFLGIPLLPLMSGFAMSDIPVLFFFYLHLLLFYLALNYRKGFIALVLASISGIVLGLTVCGRQTYLVALVGVAALWWQMGEKRKLLLVYFLSAVPFPLALFILWGNIVPPRVAGLEAQNASHFSSTHLFLSLSQAAILYAIYDIKFLFRRTKVSTLVILASIILIPIFDRYFVTDLSERLPARFLFQRYLSSSLYLPITRGLLAISFGMGFLFICELVSEFRRAKDPVVQWMYLVALSLIFAQGFVTHMYSSRYPAVALPLLVLLLSKQSPSSFARAFRILIGGTSGVAVLAIYLGLIKFAL
jgi:hypothetical protein